MVILCLSQKGMVIIMKSTSHFAIAHLLYYSLREQGISLDRTAFAYGNIAPDYRPALAVTPHFGRVCTRNIEELSRELAQIPLDGSGTVGAEYSKRLGMVCHYICDYFCLAHNRSFLGGVKQHMLFENELDQYLRTHWKDLPENSAFERLSRSRGVHQLLGRLETEKSAYCKNGYSFENDLTCAFRACLAVISAVVAMSGAVCVQRNERAEELPLTLKGFATGNCYVFRMFFYKNRNNNIFFMPELMQPILT
jgi:hypothetical protein